MANNTPDPDSTAPLEATPSTTPANTSASRKSSPGESRKSETSSTAPSTAPPTLQKQTSSTLLPTSTSSAGASPRTSRNTSPIRKDSRQQPLANPPSTQPSAAAIQRALSAAAVPQLSPAPSAEPASKLPKAPKSAGASGDNTPRWPTSPRLKSPPPSTSNSRRGSAAAQQQQQQKKGETTAAAAPVISVQGASPQNGTPPPPAKQGSDDIAKVQLQTPGKGSSRGVSGKSTLETVQENSADDVREPSPAAIKAAADLKPLTKLNEDDGKASKGDAVNGESETQSLNAGSGSESAGKADKKKDQNSIASRPKNGTAKNYASLASAKSRQPEGKQNMTVETETVQSIPQSAINAGDRSGSTRNDTGGSVRLKPSIETIRPKKDRKRTTQKARSINQGTGAYYLRSPLLICQDMLVHSDATVVESSTSSSTARDETSASDLGSPPPRLRRPSHAPPLRRSLSLRTPSQYFRALSDSFLRKASSKADIFEARVANAVDEANSSDSEETFVYESNPPEPQRRARHHSRTPSVTSSHSVAEGQRGVRSFGDVMDERRVAGKRSMKFSNNAYNETDSPEGTKDGSVRSYTPRHFGRFGRGGSHASMFDPDSPFTQASKLRNQQLGSKRSRPGSPRSPQNALQQQRASGMFGKKQEPSYDFDAEGGDDERTPLVGTVRTPRNGRLPRRISSRGGGEIDEYYGVRRHPRCGRFSGCVLGFIVFAAAILAAIAFLVMSNRPMYDIQVHKIENVLASEQELIFDMLVGAINPNALGISVTEMNLDVFAKSKHVQDAKLRRVRQGGGLGGTRGKRRRIPLPPPPEPFPDTSGDWIDLSHQWRSPRIRGGVDEGTDPPEDGDLDGDAETMLLGRVYHFDQPLEFEGSPLKRHLHYSVGELRLSKPGNATEEGGSAKWEEVIQHPFQLIIRGVLQYRLPISSRVESAAVRASVLVHPEDGVDDLGRMRVVPIEEESVLEVE